MARPAAAAKTLDEIAAWRAACPDITLRSTFIVGYPGETEEEFQGLLDFARALEFDKVGAFTFSPEPGTPAAELPDQVDDEVKQARYARLMEQQQPISLRKNQAQVGRMLEILVEDDGPGLPEAVRAAVLQRGVRADEATPGSGLGLSIVSDLAGLYGGSLELESSPLGGLRARLRLPAA